MRKRRSGVMGRRVYSVVVLVALTLFLFLYNWTVETIPLAHIEPQVEWVDIHNLLTQESLTESELRILSEQTGLYPEGIQRLIGQGRGKELLTMQQQYFAPRQVKAQPSTPVTISEVLVDEQGRICYGMPLADIQDGDILLTKNSRFLGWRNGHAALVVNAGKGQILEAVMPGTNTKISSLSKWSTYPSFLVLRLKEEYRAGNVPKQVAAYAAQELADVPYLLTAGMWTRKSEQNTGDSENHAEKELKGTQCAHLVWYVYKQFGIDLDSDGGIIVTPYDIQNSEYLDIIQTYGY